MDMRHVFGGVPFAVALLGPVAPAGPASPAVTHSCKYESRGGILAEASIELREGKVTKVELSDLFPGRPGELGYSCYIQTARDDGDMKWRDVEGAIEIELSNSADFGDGSFMVVRPTAKGFNFDLSRAKSSGICGAGAELPAALTIVKASKTCLFRRQ
jgi:hypothetical protein